MNVLAPNMMGENLTNRGVDELVANRGFGVTEIQNLANPQAAMDRGQTATPAVLQNKRKIGLARQFGVTKDEVAG